MAKRPVRSRAPEAPGAPQPPTANDSAVAAPPPRSTSTPKAALEASDLRSNSMGSEPSEEDIRLRAYQRYLERGGGHGLEFEDWLEAERELKKL